METPQDWECRLWERIKESLEESGRVSSSYYVMAEEAVFLCRLSEWRQAVQRYCELEADYE